MFSAFENDSSIGIRKSQPTIGQRATFASGRSSWFGFLRLTCSWRCFGASSLAHLRLLSLRHTPSFREKEDQRADEVCDQGDADNFGRENGPAFHWNNRHQGQG